MKGCFITLVVFSSLLLGISTEAVEEHVSSPTKIVLLLEARVKGPYVRVGDIVEIVEAESEGAKPCVEAIQRLVVARPQRFPVFFSADALKMRLKSEDIEVEVSGAKYCRIMQISTGNDAGNLVPGIASRHTLLYGIEVKFYSSQIRLSQYLETEIVNMFAAGDRAGVSRGLVQASACGVIIAREILNRIS